MINSLHCFCNSSLFKTELITLCASERNVRSPSFTISNVICLKFTDLCYNVFNIYFKLVYCWLSCVYFSLAKVINPIYVQWVTEGIRPPIQNIVAISKHITICILHPVTARSVTMHKLICNFIHIRNTLVLALFSSILKSLLSSETSGNIHTNILRRIPEDRNSQLLCRENLKVFINSNFKFHSFSFLKRMIFSRLCSD